MAPNPVLKIAIFNSGRTQIAIAEKAGIHDTRLSKIIRGHLEPNEDERRALARVLRKSIHELFPEAIAS